MDIGCSRLAAQRLTEPRCKSPGDVVRWMGAVQAQDYGQAVWAIGSRLSAGSVSAVERAIAAHQLVRTWPMRGTLHFVAPENVRWMLKLSEDRQRAATKTRHAQLELDAATLKRSHALFEKALANGQTLTRSAMMALLEGAGIPTQEYRGYHILGHAAQTGLILVGPMAGKEQTFVLLDDCVPDAPSLSREESLRELARMFFTSHGPATVQDFAWWGGLTLTDARAGLESAKDDLASEGIWWFGKRRLEKAAARVHLLPGYDEYLLGYKDRGDVLDKAHAPRIVPGGNGVFYPIVVIDGQVVGTWKRKVTKKGVEVAIATFGPQEDLEAELRRAAEDYCRFMEVPLASFKA